jgi:predicted transposase YbfD/YdcC
LDKDHGRLEVRQLRCQPTTPQTIGLAGVAQIIRVDRHIQTVRQGKVVKETDEVAFAVTSYWPEQAGPEQLLELVRDHWSIENGQHYRRDRTQDEDRCTVSDTTAARNLSLFRSLAIFLFKTQSKSKGGKKSLPDFQSHVHRHPWGLIRRFTLNRHEE